MKQSLVATLMVQASNVGMMEHMEIYNMVVSIGLMTWIYDIEFMLRSNMAASSSWSNGPNKKCLLEKNTLICVAIYGHMKKNIENSGHGFCEKWPQLDDTWEKSQNNCSFRDTNGCLKGMLSDLLLQLVFQISNLLK